MTIFFVAGKKCYSLSFAIWWSKYLTRALQSNPFQNPGGVDWASRTKSEQIEILVSNIGLFFDDMLPTLHGIWRWGRALAVFNPHYFLIQGWRGWDGFLSIRDVSRKNGYSCVYYNDLTLFTNRDIYHIYIKSLWGYFSNILDNNYKVQWNKKIAFPN